jgi:hypothetical protein
MEVTTAVAHPEQWKTMEEGSEDNREMMVVKDKEQKFQTQLHPKFKFSYILSFHAASIQC